MIGRHPCIRPSFLVSNWTARGSLLRLAVSHSTHPSLRPLTPPTPAAVVIIQDAIGEPLPSTPAPPDAAWEEEVLAAPPRLVAWPEDGNKGVGGGGAGDILNNTVVVEGTPAVETPVMTVGEETPGDNVNRGGETAQGGSALNTSFLI